MLPRDIILVRHGQSEGNVATEASKMGDNRHFTEAFRNRHSREFRLTDLGIQQAKAAGDWIRKNVPFSFNSFYVSDYIRAKETAVHLGLPNAKWKEEFHLRERDRALADNIPRDEERALFPMEQKQYGIDPFLSVPAGGGESFASFCLRLKAGFIEHLSRQPPKSAMVVVSHGHGMRGLQLEFENLSHDDFIRLDRSDVPSEKMNNCQILWYTRRDPNNPMVTSERLLAVRSVCPWKEDGDYGWRYIERKLSTNEDLLEEVSRYSRFVNG